MEAGGVEGSVETPLSLSSPAVYSPGCKPPLQPLLPHLETLLASNKQQLCPALLGHLDAEA